MNTGELARLPRILYTVKVSEHVALTHPPFPPMSGGGTHLSMAGSGAQRVMTGVRVLEEYNMTEGTATVSIPTDCNIPNFKNVPLRHLRPYVYSLEGTPWISDNPADADHVSMLRCSEPSCTNPATHNDGSPEHEYLCFVYIVHVPINTPTSLLNSMATICLWVFAH